ncbi:MAG: Ig-like domain-containing protein [Sphingobacteriales bacterium JAD_PAG50586_3]|nr:MAG: Ig-like domain-containing protein [Sphingobacteriales bacterium JAD_PAG50586_3]
MNTFLKYITGLCVLLTAAGCAIRVAPTGGTKDTQPPVMLNVSPDTFSTNFNSETIEFEFDEFYQLNDLTNRLVISPPMEKPPVPKIKGKRLILELQEPLKPNTTYNFNFGTAIADVNESNAMQDFRYVFSTGSFIDSLSINGAVYNAFTGAPEKDVTILLYKGTADSLPYKEKPAYFTKTNDGGNFLLNYMAPGKYKIFALKETNNNYLLDAEDEQIAFIDSLVDAAKYPNVQFKMFKPERRKQKLLKKEFTMPGKLVLTFNKPVKEFKLTHLHAPADTGFYVTEYNTNRDSLTVWIKNIKTDSLRLVLTDEVVIDTIKLNNIRAVKRMVRGQHPHAPILPLPC